MDKVTTAAEAVKRLKDGDTLMCGGFLQSGSPETLIGKLLEKDVKNLTVISNDLGTNTTRMAQVMQQGKVDKIICSFLGMNKVAGQMMIDHPENVELSPQGTLAERIRCGGSGLKGFYTPVGVGTPVEEGKEKRFIGGRDCLLELPLHGNVTFFRATIADKAGNCFLRGTTKSFSVVMATASDYVVVEAEKIVEQGELDPELVTIPSAYVCAVVPVEE